MSPGKFLCKLVKMNDFQKLRLIIRKNGSIVNQINDTGETPAFVALKLGLPECFKILYTNEG